MTTQLTYRAETASQTAGPYVHLGLAPRACGLEVFAHEYSNVVFAGRGPRIVIEGRIIDGSGTPVRDALVELWQADAEGQYVRDEPADPKALQPEGWGRAVSDFASGMYRFDTIKPGAVRGRRGELMAPFVGLWIVARGINVGLHTRVYFADEATNASDPVLKTIEWEVRRQTLIAQRREDKGVAVYRFDIVLQGPDETVFFDV